jgi:hypothetical protein
MQQIHAKIDILLNHKQIDSDINEAVYIVVYLSIYSRISKYI